MTNFIKKRLIEVIMIAYNVIILSKYFLDKISICCEPCFTGDCPPCETDFMKNIWIYLLYGNFVFVLSLIIRKIMRNKKNT